jgi:hypothetical protein
MRDGQLFGLSLKTETHLETYLDANPLRTKGNTNNPDIPSPTHSRQPPCTLLPYRDRQAPRKGIEPITAWLGSFK